ncbi:MAG: vitamin K epoxide reductase family protein, partial [Hyphomicrobiales bacterium]
MSDLNREFNIAGASAGHDQPAVLSAAVPVAGEHSAQVQRRVPYVMMALALIGLAVAFYDSYAIYNGQLLWCPPPINGCNEVAASPYARIFDLPVGYYG